MPILIYLFLIDNGFLKDKAMIEERRKQADIRFAQFEFGYTVKDVGGWEIAGDLWKRAVFLEKDDWDKPSIGGSYYLRFHPHSAEIDTEWANVNGDFLT